MYNVLSDTELRHDTSCINPAGIQTARCGGTTEVDLSVRTDMTPEEAYRICVRSWECIGSMNPGGYSSFNAKTGRAIPSKSALCFMALTRRHYPFRRSMAKSRGSVSRLSRSAPGPVSAVIDPIPAGLARAVG